MRGFGFNSVSIAIAALTIGTAAQAEPHVNRTTQAAGLILYQDHADPEQFFYVPSNVPVVLGETLEDFKVTYWGIARPFYSDTDASSLFGGTVSARAALCATEAQLERARTAVKQQFGVDNAKMSPIRLRPGPEVQPVWAANTIRMGAQGDVVFPSDVAFCNTFNFIIGTGNSLFALYVATEAIGSSGPTPNPDFGVNISGKAQFEADPWRATCSADLAQVWSHVRRQFSASARIGWFRVGSAQYLKITQDLTRNNVIKCSFEEGDMDLRTYGYQVFDMVKGALENVNAAITAGEGFFRFEPLPTPETVNAETAKLGWPYSLSINAAYSENHFKQEISWSQEIKYAGRIEQDVPVSMTLAVSCNRATERYFVDLTDPRSPCITAQKSDDFFDRRDRERGHQNRAREIVQNRYDSGEYDRNDYERIIDALDEKSLTEDLERVAVATDQGPGALAIGVQGLVAGTDIELYLEDLESKIIVD